MRQKYWSTMEIIRYFQKFGPYKINIHSVCLFFVKVFLMKLLTIIQVVAALPALTAQCLNSVNNLSLEVHCDKRNVLFVCSISFYFYRSQEDRFRFEKKNQNTRQDNFENRVICAKSSGFQPGIVRRIEAENAGKSVDKVEQGGDCVMSYGEKNGAKCASLEYVPIIYYNIIYIIIYIILLWGIFVKTDNITQLSSQSNQDNYKLQQFLHLYLS